MFTSRFLVGVFLGLSLLSTMGCGGRDCTVTSLTVAPPTATADHLAAAPGNKVQFFGFDNLSTLPSGCVTVAIAQAARPDLTWASSDSLNVTIGNTSGVDYGLATCNNATSSAVTITATGPNAKHVEISGTAMLTCK